MPVRCYGLIFIEYMSILLFRVAPSTTHVHCGRLWSSLWSLEEGLENVSVATDCLSVVQRIVSTNLDRSPCGTVIKDIKQLCASFTACSIYHVRREHNVAAHLLSRSCNQLVCRVWRGVPPECIREAICIDSLSL